MSLEDLRNKLQAKLKKSCVVIVANGQAMATLKECCKSLKEHIKLTHDVDFYCTFDLPMLDQINEMGVDKDGEWIVEGLPITRVVTQCPPIFASRSTYWNMLHMIPKFREYDSGIMISSKVGLGKDITDDMITDGASFTIRNNICITCTKDYTTGQYMRACTEDSSAYKYSEEDLPTYNNVIWGGDIVTCCTEVEDMIEKDLSNNILLANPSYYFNKYLWSHKPTIEWIENVDYQNDIQLCIDKWKPEIDKLNKAMMEYDTAHPEKEIKDKNPNNPAYENLPPVTYKRVPYGDDVALKILNTDQEYTVLLLSKSQRQFIKFEA